MGKEGGKDGEGGQGRGWRLKEKNKKEKNKKDVNNNVYTFHFPAGFNCLYTNADCLSNKIQELKTIVKNTNPLVIAVTETEPKHQRFTLSTPELAIEKYEMFLTPLDSNDGRGCILYVHQELQPSEATFESPYKDQIWCTVKLNNEDMFLIGCLYRSPGQSMEQNNIY